MDEEGGEWEVWEEAPQGQFLRNLVLPPGHHFRTDLRPTGHEHDFFVGALLFAPSALPPAAPWSAPHTKQRQTIARMWLQAEKAKNQPLAT